MALTSRLPRPAAHGIVGVAGLAAMTIRVDLLLLAGSTYSCWSAM